MEDVMWLHTSPQLTNYVLNLSNMDLPKAPFLRHLFSTLEESYCNLFFLDVWLFRLGSWSGLTELFVIWLTRDCFYLPDLDTSIETICLPVINISLQEHSS
jgi:hypothetical protein